MAVPTDWTDELAGVPSTAGPDGDIARQRNRVRLSIASGVLALVTAAAVIGVLIHGQRSPDGPFNTIELVAVLLLVMWATSVTGFMLAFLGDHHSGRPRLNRVALVFCAALVLAAVALTWLAAWYVLIPVLLLLAILGIIKLPS